MILQLTKAEVYAIRFCVYLAGHPDEWVTATKAANAQGIPLTRLTYTTQTLRRGGVLIGRKGQGYKLRRNRYEMGVDDVLKAMRPNMGCGLSLIGPFMQEAADCVAVEEMHDDIEKACAITLGYLAELRFGEAA